MHVFIPLWFYGFDSVMYFIVSMIGFLLSFYFHKMHSISSEKKHMYLDLGFLLLSIGFLILSITNAYSYLNFTNCHASCVLGTIDKIFSIEDFSYFTFFALSIFAYVLFIFTYENENINFVKIFFPLFLIYLVLVLAFLPKEETTAMWYSYIEYYNLVALTLTMFVTFKNFINYNEKKTLNSLMVAISFAFISSFHLFYLFSFASEVMYVISHVFLLIGFSTLLAMVLRVKRK